MPEELTVIEQIELDLVETLEGIEDVTDVQRWDEFGNDVEHLTIVIRVGFEKVKPSSDDLHHNTAPVEIDLFIARPESDEEVGAAFLNRWKGRLRAALMDDPGRGGWALPSGTQITGIGLVDPQDQDEGGGELVLRTQLMIDYRHPEDDPYNPG